MTNYCHLSYEDRKNIEDGLNENKSINQISKEISRNHSTILREIDRNKKYSEPSSWNNYKINHPDLDLSCERLKHSPYVCNGCKSRSGCRKIRWTYYAREAQKALILTQKKYIILIKLLLLLLKKAKQLIIYL